MAPRTSRRHSSSSSATSAGVACLTASPRGEPLVLIFFEDPDTDEASRLTRFGIDDRAVIDALRVAVRYVDDQNRTAVVPKLEVGILDWGLVFVSRVDRRHRWVEAAHARPEMEFHLG